MALAPGAQVGTTSWVAVCQKTWLQEALAVLNAAGRSVQKIVPEFEPGATATYLIGQAEQAQLVHIDEQGVLVAHLRQPLREVLHSWAATLANAKSAPLWAEPALAEAAQEGLHRPAQLISPAQRLWQAAQSDWNLAQFDLAAKAGGQGRQKVLRAWSQVWRSAQWRPLRWGLLALVLVQGLGLMQQQKQ
jgi:general secretion pathway protein L